MTSKGFLENDVSEVQESPLHGRGVFATKFTPKDALVCVYDGEEVKLIDITPTADQTYLMQSPEDPTLGIIGHTKIQSKGGYGQLANDGAILELAEPEKSIQSFVAIMNYARDSFNRATIAFKNGGGSGLYSIRDTKKGEEHFMHYGAVYWLRRCRNEIMRQYKEAVSEGQTNLAVLLEHRLQCALGLSNIYKQVKTAQHYSQTNKALLYLTSIDSDLCNRMTFDDRMKAVNHAFGLK